MLLVKLLAMLQKDKDGSLHERLAMVESTLLMIRYGFVCMHFISIV